MNESAAILARRRFAKTYANGYTNHRPRDMGCNYKHGDLGIFLPAWLGGGCHACLRVNHGFDCDNGRSESHHEGL